MGTQRTSFVHILDDDSLLECVNSTSSDSTMNVSMCEHTQSRQSLFSLVATREGDNKRFRLKYNASKFQAKDSVSLFLTTLHEKGVYNIRVHQLARGGLWGNYYYDLVLHEKRMERIDEAVNLTWTQDIGSSMRWHGFIKRPEMNNSTACCMFQVEGQNTRFWIERFLVIDSWNDSTFSPAFYELGKSTSRDNSDLFELTLEVGQLSSPSHIRLLWNATGQIEVIGSEFLYFQVRMYSLSHVVTLTSCQGDSLSTSFSL